MDLGTVLSVAQSLIATLHSNELKRICSILNYKSELIEELQNTVRTVEAVLRDAETKQVVCHQAQLYIEKLKDAVYDADDLFDKFVTISEQKKLKKGEKAFEKVRDFFSSHNPFVEAFKMSHEVKAVRKQLDDIASNHTQFGFSIDPQPIRLKREETGSQVNENNIIGRENDVEKIVGHLLNASKKDEVSFLAIVGIGGLGKTALAQMVYNDSRVRAAFSQRIWTCVSDHDQLQLDVNQVLRKILDSNHDGSVDSLRSRVLEKLTKSKFLLVLDDVWTENRHHWSKLGDFLLKGRQGSYVVITTRSHETARIIGDDPIVHELQGLSKEKALCLFKKEAFGFGPKQSIASPREDLIAIGEEIVESCVGVPLAIKVAGSLLYGQQKSTWLSFQKNRISNNDIRDILKLSYDHLESPHKSCFTYCALFPKDYELDVDTLKCLWIAQGYIVPSKDGQSKEEIAHEYFLVLTKRCFFQDVVRNELGQFVSCKIHDLLHDIGQSVAGKEIFLPSLAIDDVKRRARHLAYTTTECLQKYSFTKTHLRSCVYVGPSLLRPKMELSMRSLEALLSNWTCLRVLILNRSDIKSLPESIGKLSLLRYLEIRENFYLMVLPQSIVKLYNLQTLILDGFWTMKELPKDFIKLVNLKRLEMIGCGIKYLTCLETLPHLNYLKLHALKELEHIYINPNGELEGSISVSTPDERSIAKGFLSFPCLETLKLCFLPNLKGWGNSRVEVGNMTPMLLPQLKSFEVVDCENMTCNLLLPKLEELELDRFNESLQINRLSKNIGDDVKAEDHGSTSTTASSSSTSSSCYDVKAKSYGVPKLRFVSTSNAEWLKRMPMVSFQCLEILMIVGDMEVKRLGEIKEVFLSCSASLVTLIIHHCPDLRYMMFGGFEYLTALETLEISACEEVIISRKTKVGFPWPPLHRSLRHLSLESLLKMNYLPSWMQFLSALETLKIDYCINLDSIPDWMPKLTSLKELQLLNCSERLNERCQHSIGADWRLIHHIPSIKIIEDSDEY